MTKRTEELLSQMSLEEKVSMAAGSALWLSTGVERLGIPPFKMTDGPNGARGDFMTTVSAACFPVGSALAATWNPSLIEKVGSALGEEAKTKDAQVLLGPTINLQRTPIGGRNFECYSEDPYLTAEIAVAFVNGVQAQGVGACPKHFIANDTEYERHTMSSDVDERPLHELYLYPFERVVKETKPWSLMSSYNRVNGTYVASSKDLMTDLLKDDWGFDGFIVSDWGGSRETVGNANAGLDLEMPGPARTMGRRLLEAVQAGDVAEEVIDDKVRRLLHLLERSGKFEAPDPKPEKAIDKPEHQALAKQAALESFVLLKNEGVLPLSPKSLDRVAIIGPNAERGQIQGGGSAGVLPHYSRHPLESLTGKWSEDVALDFQRGCLTNKFVPFISGDQVSSPDRGNEPGFRYEMFANDSFSGEPVSTKIQTRGMVFFGSQEAAGVVGPFTVRLSGRFTAKDTGAHEFGVMSAGLSRLKVDGAEVIDNWTDQTPGESFFGFGSTEKRASIDMVAGRTYDLVVEFARESNKMLSGVRFGMQPPVSEFLMGDAVAAATNADAAILVVGTNADWETEGNDRSTMALPGDQDELIERVLDANPNTVVVVNAGSPVEMPWLEKANAVLWCWFPGQEFGAALTDILDGTANPSGRLPCTFPYMLEDTPAYTSYPGEKGRVRYGEGIFAGYRWYQSRDILPVFPFGHGLSYSYFFYDNLQLPEQIKAGSPVTVTVDVANESALEGREVVQVYVRAKDSAVARPFQELKAFTKLSLVPGETQTVSLTLRADSFAYWDIEDHAWRIEAGVYEICVGTTSEEIWLTAELNVTE